MKKKLEYLYENIINEKTLTSQKIAIIKSINTGQESQATLYKIISLLIVKRVRPF